MSENVFNYFIKNNYLYQDLFKQCCFVGYRKNKPNYIIKRSSSSSKFYFNGDSSGCDYENGFFINNKSNDMIIFEAPIDAMSFMSILEKNNIDYQKTYNYLILGSVNKTKSISNILKEYSNINNIIIGLDNDNAGKKGVDNIKKIIEEMNININTKIIYPQMKDFNEDIQNNLFSLEDNEILKKKEFNMNKVNINNKNKEKKEFFINSIKEELSNLYDDPKEIIEFLEFMGKFYNYSIRNNILIKKQNRGAMFVGSYKKFQDMGYYVQKGQKGMKILVPVVYKTFQDPLTKKNNIIFTSNKRTKK